MTSTNASSAAASSALVSSGSGVNLHPMCVPHVPHDAMVHWYPGNQLCSLLGTPCSRSLGPADAPLTVIMSWTAPPGLTNDPVAPASDTKTMSDILAKPTPHRAHVSNKSQDALSLRKSSTSLRRSTVEFELSKRQRWVASSGKRDATAFDSDSGSFGKASTSRTVSAMNALRLTRSARRLASKARYTAALCGVSARDRWLRANAFFGSPC